MARNDYSYWLRHDLFPNKCDLLEKIPFISDDDAEVKIPLCNKLYTTRSFF